MATLVPQTAPKAKATKQPEGIPVDPTNFARAETDRYFASVVADGGFGKFVHHRAPPPVDRQLVVRGNLDTLYSTALFDLDAGPVTITLPDAGTRFRSLMILDQDHYVDAIVHEAGPFVLDREDYDTRYVLAAVRTFLDPNDPNDVSEAHALQDAIEVKQESFGRFEIPSWDRVSQAKVRDALLVLGSTIPSLRHAFGKKGEVDPIAHLIGSAAAWGGTPEDEATYLNVTPTQNDGKTIYTLSVRDVPVDAFWSVTVYDATGYYRANPRNLYSLNSVTAKKSDDGSYTIQFGGDCESATNCLPTYPGWNYLVRLYRPRHEILTGQWKFPEATPKK